MDGVVDAAALGEVAAAAADDARDDVPLPPVLTNFPLHIKRPAGVPTKDSMNK